LSWRSHTKYCLIIRVAESES